MTKIIEWVEEPSKNHTQHAYAFCPLYMTVIGKAGSGKSFLIKTLVAMVRQLTQVNNSVIVCGPTGVYSNLFILFIITHKASVCQSIHTV